MRGVGELFAARAALKGLRLDIQVAAEVPAWLVGDALRLTQILNNLVGNAVKFTGTGEVKVSVTRLPDEAKQEAVLQFSVRDSGIGMSETQMEHIFQPFTQADGSISRRYGGTGLGLSISQRLVRAMGGELLAQSVPGEGSCFGFTLRLAIAAHEAPAAGESLPRALPQSQSHRHGVEAGAPAAAEEDWTEDPATQLGQIAELLRQDEFVPRALLRALRASATAPARTADIDRLCDLIERTDYRAALTLIEDMR